MHCAIVHPLLCFLSLACTASLFAQATLTWSGAGGDDNWSTGTNWGGTTPMAGDILQFGGSTRLGPVNDFAADTVFGGITFLNNTNPTTSAFTLSGSRITLGGDIMTNAVTGGSFNATINDVINLDLLLNGTRTITTTNSSDKTHNLTIDGAITDGGGGFGLIKSGGARLTLNGSSTTRLVTLTNGLLNINHASAIGAGTLDINAGAIDNTSGAAITVATANLLTLDGNFAFGGSDDLSFANGTALIAAGRTITLNGTGRTLTLGATTMSGSSSTLTANLGAGASANLLVLGSLDLAAAADASSRTRTIAGDAGVRIDGGIVNGGTAANGLTFTGTSLLTLAAANAYTGTTTVNTMSGTLRVNAASNISNGSLVITQGTLELNNSAQTVGVITLGSTTNTSQMSAASIILSAGTTLTQTGNMTANDNVNT